MGCFARTCGISGTGINEGEKVVVIILNLPYKYIDLSTLMREVGEQQNKFHKAEEVKTHSELFMNAVLNKEVKGMEEWTLFDFKPLKEVARGTYNDYGFIEEMEQPEEIEGIQGEMYGNNSGMAHLLFHEWAVEFLFGKKIEEIKLDIDFAVKLLWKIYHLRRSPIDWMLGQQHPDIEEMKKQIALNVRTNQFLTEKINQYEKEYGADTN